MILLKNRLGYDYSLDAFGIHGTEASVGAMGLTFSSGTPVADGCGQGTGLGILSQLKVQAFAVGTTSFFPCA